MISVSEISTIVKNEAALCGFDACGIAKADCLSDKKSALQNWLNNGYNGTMTYMQNHFEMRLNPRLIVENAKSVICLLISYNGDARQNSNVPKIARYAFGNDYHIIIREKLNNLLVALQKNIPKLNGRGFVDSAPVLEREWAFRAGLGWCGKSTAFISPVFGSYVFLAELIVDVEMEYDKPVDENFCETCNKCIANCPTAAIIEPYVVDARKCISYQTIENKGDINVSTCGWLFGCDVCLQVCPCNENARICNHYEFEPITEIANMNFTEWENITEKDFNKIFAKSPLMRAGYNRIKRNLKNIQQHYYKQNT
jgi:epoxyqueuosine reductase